MRIYLDHNATAPVRPEARAAYLAALDGHANPSSPHAEGQGARAAVERARRAVGALVGVHPREVIFTATGTEALNLAIHGALAALAGQRDEILVSAAEHEAVLAAAAAMGESGVRRRVVPVGADGRVDLAALAAALGPRTALVAVQVANNETGVLQPVVEAAALAHRAGALLLADAVQAVGRIPVDRRALGADFLALSGHKLGAGPGAAALVARTGAPLAPLVHGGGQERGLRSGTENLAAIAALGAVAGLLASRLAEEGERLERLRDGFEARVAAACPGAGFHGRGAARLPNTSFVHLPGADAQALVVALDLAGIACSTGAACASGAAEPSHVLAAMGVAPAIARATLRFSFGWSSGPADGERAAEALAAALKAQHQAGIAAQGGR